MKRLISIALVFLSISTSSQLMAKQPKKGHSSIAFQKPSNMNILYVGIDNPIEVKAPNIDESSLVVKFSVDGIGEIKRLSKDHYIATVYKPGLSQIDIYDGASIVNSQQYRCNYTPDPVGALDGKYRGGNMTPNVLKTIKGVAAVLDNFEFDAKFRVDSFSVLYESKGDLHTAVSNGPLLTEEMKSYFANAEPKDIIIIRDISLTDYKGMNRRIAPLLFIVL